MESILRRARKNDASSAAWLQPYLGLARPLIAGIRNATRNVVISKIDSPFFIVYWRDHLQLQKMEIVWPSFSSSKPGGPGLERL